MFKKQPSPTPRGVPLDQLELALNQTTLRAKRDGDTLVVEHDRFVTRINVSAPQVAEAVDAKIAAIVTIKSELPAEFSQIFANPSFAATVNSMATLGALMVENGRHIVGSRLTVYEDHHARAFCQNDAVFKDFLLSRIVDIGEQGPSTAMAGQDEAWNSEVVLEIGPHPDLSDTQRRAIEMDFGMVDGRAEIVVRSALLFYALKRLRLDTDPAARSPQDQQIVLVNRDEVFEQKAVK